MTAFLALDRQFDDVAVAHEPRHAEVRRLARKPRSASRSAATMPSFDHDDAIGERQRLVLVVRDVDRRAVELAMDAPDLRARLEAQLGVEVRQRFVHQDQRRLDDDRARDRHPLLLPARELPRQLALLARQLHELERPVDPGGDVVGRDAAHPESEADVPRHAHVREQRVVLEHHAEAALLRRQHVDPLVVEPDAALGQRHQPRDAVQRGRLAAAGRAEQRDELAAPDRQRHVGQRVERLARGTREAARHAVEFELGKILFHVCSLWRWQGSGIRNAPLRSSSSTPGLPWAGVRARRPNVARHQWGSRRDHTAFRSRPTRWRAATGSDGVTFLSSRRPADPRCGTRPPAPPAATTACAEIR